MLPIREIAQQTLEAGYLSIEQEEQLRELLQKTKYGSEDLNAFMNLQQAVMRGEVKQESREALSFA